MWQLFKAEMDYNKWADLIFYILIAFTFLSNSMLGNLEIPLAGIMFGSLMLSAFYTGFSWTASKRVSFLSSLPIPVKHIEIVRNIRFLLLVIIWALALFLSSMISQHGHLGKEYLYWLVNKVGFILIIAGFANLESNVKNSVKNNMSGKVCYIVYQIIQTSIFLLSIVLLIFSIEKPSFFDDVFYIRLSEMLLTFPVSSGLVFIGLMIMILDIFIFGLRKNYTVETVWNWFFK